MNGLNKRALVTKGKQPLVIEEKPIHTPPPEGIVIKTHYTGICHSDVHLWENETAIDENTKIHIYSDEDFPILLGHEISGEVYSIGNHVTDGELKVGDKVVLHVWVGCKDCGLCKGGRENICAQANKRYYGNNPYVEGGYQQYVSVEFASDVLKVPDNLPMDVAALMPCSGLTAYNAVSAAKPVIQEFIRYNGSVTMLVVGAGGLAQWAIQIAKAVLPPEGVTIVCADISEERVALGKQAGADKTIVWPISASNAEIMAASKAVVPDGFNAVLDFVNSPMTIGRTHTILEKGGVLCQVGLFGGCGHTLPLTSIPLGGISIIGVLNGCFKQLKELFQLVSTHQVKSPPIFKVRLEEAHDYLLKLRGGKLPGRAVIDFTQ